jgi:hypothetical protein
VHSELAQSVQSVDAIMSKLCALHRRPALALDELLDVRRVDTGTHNPRHRGERGAEQLAVQIPGSPGYIQISLPKSLPVGRSQLGVGGIETAELRQVSQLAEMDVAQRPIIEKRARAIEEDRGGAC